jgi:hypothetical protein
MKRLLGPLSMIGVILFMAMTVFAGDVYINNSTTRWGTYSSFTVDENGKLSITGTPDTPPPTTGNTIKGKITNSTHFTTPTGSPISIGIPGVTVDLTGPATKSTTTGADGTYQFTGLANGDGYTVTPSKANYLFTPENLVLNFTGGGNETVSNADFAADALADYTIAGTVFDKATPTPGVLSGVTVELRLGSTLVDSDSTDSDLVNGSGVYTFPQLLSGFTYRVTPVSGTKTFNPAYYDVLINSGDVTGKNFTEVSTPTGTYAAAVSGAKKLNTVITTNGTTPAGYGMGYYGSLNPSAASCKAGKTYFLLDTSWKSNFTPKSLVKWINFNVTGPSQTTNLIKLDSNDNGTVIDYITAKQDSFPIPASGRYLIEVVSTVAFNLTIWW